MRALSPIANGVVSACALTGLGLLLGRAFTPASARAEPELEPAENWQALVTGGTTVGPSTAPAVLVTFSDFQCPFCALLARAVAELRADQPDRLRMVYRHFPLERIHPHAYAAALASECAREQGRFEALHDLLYARQKEIGTVPWGNLAVAAAVNDTARFRACMDQDRYRDRIRADVALAEVSDVQGTPTIFLNGKRVRAGLSPERLLRLIEDAARL